MIVPAVYDTKHFHPVIFSVLMSQGRCGKPKQAESSWGLWDRRGCWRKSPKQYYSSLSAWEVGTEIPPLWQQTVFSSDPSSLFLMIYTEQTWQHNEIFSFLNLQTMSVDVFWGWMDIIISVSWRYAVETGHLWRRHYIERIGIADKALDFYWTFCWHLRPHEDLSARFYF